MEAAAHVEHVGGPRLQALQLRKGRGHPTTLVVIQTKGARRLFDWRVERGAHLKEKALVIVEDLFAVQQREVYAKSVRFLPKHGGMRGPDEADHHQDEFVMGECDGSHAETPSGHEPAN
jgi:hypothetical protein